MPVKLAGFNVSAELVEKIKNGTLTDKEVAALGPEPIAAAYARISRDPRDVGKLREIARQKVVGARKSNAKIYFDMGHHTIAEHSVFNFDVIGVSRLAVEDIEETRRGAVYTEKSQRYQKIGGNFVIPEDITDPNDKTMFIDLIRFQDEQYEFMYGVLEQHFRSKFPDLDALAVENMAKEDARYVTSLAQVAQLGMTINARALEKKIRNFLANPKQETRQLGREFYDAAGKIAPSLIFLATEEGFYQYWEERAAEIEESNLEEAKRLRSLKYDNDHIKNTRKHLTRIVEEAVRETTTPDVAEKKYMHQDGNVRLVKHTQDPEIIMAATLIHQNSNETYARSLLRAHDLRSKGRLGKFLVDSVRYVGKHDSPPEVWESVHFAFEIIGSAAFFGQLKRHRVMLTAKQRYDIELGVKAPASFEEANLISRLKRVEERTNRVYDQLKTKYGVDIAEYVIMQAQQRRVHVDINARQLAGIFTGLRCDRHAQAEIRDVANSMAKIASELTPSVKHLYSGKDTFDRAKAEAYEY